VDYEDTSAETSAELWLDHRHYRTYEIALGITRAVAASADLRDLEFLNEAVVDFLSPWQMETAVHRFARVVADEIFMKDIDGPYIGTYERDANSSIVTQRYLPVDFALRSYGICDDEMFRVPPPDGAWVSEGNINTWKESSKVANACYDYTVDLQWSDAYDQLLTRLADEVFHTIFPNRALLSRVHEVLAIYVQQQDPESFADDPASARLFKAAGRLERVPPPQWTKHAIFYRDRGRCVICGKDLTSLIDPQSDAEYDHVVPLELGGLNDVSNLQLLCRACNRRKAADLVRPSTRHRWYYGLNR
jgi:5-methylcytosine-specific restriction endonuclease McrA